VASRSGLVEVESQLAAGTRFRKKYVGRRQFAVPECDSVVLIRLLKNGTLFVGLDEQDFICTDPAIAKELVRMRADEQLAGLEFVQALPLHLADFLLQLSEQLWKLPHNFRVKGELRFFEEEGPFSLEHRPHETEKAERAV